MKIAVLEYNAADDVTWNRKAIKQSLKKQINEISLLRENHNYFHIAHSVSFCNQATNFGF